MSIAIPRCSVPVLAALSLLMPRDALATPSAPGRIELASSDEAGQAVGGLPAGGALCALSADGRTVAYSTTSAGLSAGDTNGKLDAYVKNLDSGTVRRASGGAARPGPMSPGARCHGMTPDGRHVVLANFEAIFVRDMLTGRLLRLSPPASSLPLVAGFLGGSISDDGQRVVFQTSPQQFWDLDRMRFVNLVPSRVMVFDRKLGTAVTLLTDDGITDHGEVSFPGGGWPMLSPDGRHVLFQTNHDPLVPGDTNGQWDVVTFDLATGDTRVVSRDGDGAQTYPTFSGYAFHGWPRWGAGNSVVFDSLTPSTLGPAGLYRKNLETGELSALLPAAQGHGGNLSPDGRHLAYAKPLGGFDQAVVERDLQTGVERLVSSSSKGRPGDGTANQPLYSGDGQAIGLQSTATQLVPGGTPAGVWQLYVKRVGVARTSP